MPPSQAQERVVPATADAVLVVEDETDLARVLAFNLGEAGFRVESAGTAAGALSAAARLRPAVVILDLMLPDRPGTEVCRALREDPALADVGILMLTARGDDADRVLGFELGADDYVVKPCTMREIVLRVRALARRCSERSAARHGPTGKVLRWRTLSVDLGVHRVFDDGREIALRPIEFKLLTALLDANGQVLSREQLLAAVWDDGAGGAVSPRTVDVHVRRVRQALRSSDPIETVHGLGYRLRQA
jgi:two-component system, OmpR family, phosphate regulon response regulator PhoB